ncbi:hypothetical protein ANCCEY_04122 [Ancylostoma ceylanicum]|uniref:Uncharacterized protein n=1 Tax=Ancylostoma ceylanicum TaxID=53326 RepID=A0A0D6LXJ9_9BILA|nr:hypothetical protein ANCCEY_04122 [Ancylostoma ceylanicum]
MFKLSVDISKHQLAARIMFSGIQRVFVTDDGSAANVTDESDSAPVLVSPRSGDSAFAFPQPKSSCASDQTLPSIREKSELTNSKLSIAGRAQRASQEPFVLMPTPAQRGVAKGQKRALSMAGVEEETDSASDASSKSGETRPNTLKKFFKRSDETMDRVLDQVDFQNKFAKLPEFTIDQLKVKGTSGSLPPTPSKLIRNLMEKVRDSPGNTPLVSNACNAVFFGPTFNNTSPDLASTEDIIPCSPLDEKSASKRLLEQRRLLSIRLVLYIGNMFFILPVDAYDFVESVSSTSDIVGFMKS